MIKNGVPIANAAILVVLLALAGLNFTRLQVNYQFYQQRIELARILQQEVTSLVQNVLLIESGEVAHFDFVAKSEKRIKSLQNRIDTDKEVAEKFLISIDEVMATVAEIKAILAVYNNSLLFYPKGVVLVREELLSSGFPQMADKVRDLERAVLLLNIHISDKQLEGDVAQRIEALRVVAGTLSENLNKSIQRLLKHNTVLIGYSTDIHLFNNMLLTNRVTQYSQRLIDKYLDELQGAVNRATTAKVKLYGILVLLLLFFAYLWWKQRSERQMNQLEQLANYDILTKLPNRSLFADRFFQAIHFSRRNGTLLAICFLDLDRFKPINDTYGHEVGDQVLIAVAERIQVGIRAGDTVSRYGGDEFVILLGELESRRQCKQLLQRIQLSIGQPVTVQGVSITIEVSIGVTMYPDDDSDMDTLIHHADLAMYAAKKSGRECCHFFGVSPQ